MAVPFQPTQFQPVSFYDKPGILVQQLLDDETTARGIWNTVAKDALLSPAERDSFSQRLKSHVGAKDPFSETAIDLITNPFVWLAALVTPVGGSAIKTGGGLFAGSKMGVALREKTPLLMGMGLLGGNPTLRGSPAAYVLSQISQSKDDFLKSLAYAGVEEKNLIARLEKKWNRKVRSIDPRVHQGKEFEQEIQDINAAIWAELNSSGTRISNAEYQMMRKAGELDHKRLVVSNPELERDISIFRGYRENGDEIWDSVKNPKELVPDARNRHLLEEKSFADDLENDAIKQSRTDRRADKKIEDLDVEKDEIANNLVYELVQTKKGPELRHLKVKDPVRAERRMVPGQTFKTNVQATGQRRIETRVGVEKESGKWANQRNVDRIVDEYDLRPYIDAMRTQLDESFIRLFGKDELVENASGVLRDLRLGTANIDDIVDTNKVKRLWRSSTTDVVKEKFYNPLTGQPEEASTGLKMISEFFPGGKEFKTLEQFDEGIRTVFDVHLKNGEYFPAGIRELVDQTGKNVITKGKPKEVQQAIAAGLTIPKAKTGVHQTWHPTDLATMERLSRGNDRAESFVTHMREQLDGELRELLPGQSLGVRRLNPHRSMMIYMDRASTTHALHIAGASTDAAGKVIYNPTLWQNIDDLQVQWGDDIKTRDGGGRMLEAGYGTSTRFMKHEPWIEGGPAKRMARGSGGIPDPEGGYSLADVLNQTYNGARETDTFTRSALKDILIPRITGRKTLVEMTDRTLTEFTRTMARGVVESPLGALLNKQGGRWGKNLYEDLRAWSDLSRTGEAPGQVAGQTARYLYTTHLGINPASVLLNITQPWLHGATWLGPAAVAKGYVNAFKELGSYMTDRVSKGLNITPEEKVALIEKHFTHAKPGQDMLGIKPDLYETLESITFGGQQTRGPLEQAIFDWPMKAFEKGEWLNRLVMAHATDHAYRAAGRYADSGALLRERLRATQSMVEETQFGGNVMNTPLIFLGHTGEGFPTLGSWTASPLARQFLTFPTRTITGFAHTSREFGAGARQFRWGQEIPQIPGMPIMADFVRGLGISSALYYVGKNFLGGDISRGLLANASTDLFGGEDFMYSEGEWDWVPVPPAYDIGLQGFRSMFTGDAETLKMTLARLMPGGVEISRALGVQREGLGLPDPFKGLVSSMQRTYADYTHMTPDGLVPFYKGDGTFVDYRKPSDLIMQGLGMDLSKSKIKGQLDGYLVKQREEILRYRNEFLNAMLANDIPGAMKFKSEFEKRFKIPLTITKSNLRQRLRNRNVPRAERILDRIPPEARQEYTGYLAARGKEMGIDPSAFDFDTPTSTSRSAEFDRPQTFDLDPETVKALQQMMKQQEKEPPLQQANYTGYVPYEWK